jgi:LacI family repressor for deo operon, udp, cdd, tsx, nupC, and nupG
MVVGIKDIAAYLELSTSTVSRALNGYDDVAAETVKRVRQAAEDLGYYPSASARNLRRRRTDKIGLALLYDSAYATFNEFFAEMIRLAAVAAERHDYNLVLYTHASQYPARLLKIAQTREVDGLLLLGDMPGIDAAIDGFVKAKMPFVVVGRMADNPAASCISPDVPAAARLALQHLVSLGHRRIGHISFVRTSRYSADRTVSYRTALEEFDLPFDPDLVAYASLEPESGARAMEALLALKSPPTAVTTYNDRLAIEALHYLARRGLRVPEDMAVVGYDDIRSAKMTNPPLTTIRYSLDCIADQAVSALLARQADADPYGQPVRSVVPVELVIRQSTAGQACEEGAASRERRSRGEEGRV